MIERLPDNIDSEPNFPRSARVYVKLKFSHDVLLTTLKGLMESGVVDRDVLNTYLLKEASTEQRLLDMHLHMHVPEEIVVDIVDEVTRKLTREVGITENQGDING